jgi:hypothetical protein
MWEIVSAIAGAVSAICDIKSTATSSEPQKQESAPEDPRPWLASRPRRSILFALRSTGWCFAVVSFVLITQPYGSYMTEREYQQLFGWIAAGPTLLIILAGLDPPKAGSTVDDDGEPGSVKGS